MLITDPRMKLTNRSGIAILFLKLINNHRYKLPTTMSGPILSFLPCIWYDLTKPSMRMIAIAMKGITMLLTIVYVKKVVLSWRSVSVNENGSTVINTSNV